MKFKLPKIDPDDAATGLALIAVCGVMLAVTLFYVTSCAAPRVLVRDSSCIHYSKVDAADCEKIQDL